MVEKIKNLIAKWMFYLAINELTYLGLALVVFKVYAYLMATFVNPIICIKYGYEGGIFIIWLIAIGSGIVFVLIYDRLKKDIFKIEKLKSKLKLKPKLLRVVIKVPIVLLFFLVFPTGFVIFIRKNVSSFNGFQKKWWIFILYMASNIPTAVAATVIAYGIIKALNLS